MKTLLPAAGALLLAVAALLPFRAAASATSAVTQPLALAISQPLAGVAAWRTTAPAFYEPGVLLFVGGGLMGLGSWLRRVTVPRDDAPPDSSFEPGPESATYVRRPGPRSSRR